MKFTTDRTKRIQADGALQSIPAGTELEVVSSNAFALEMPYKRIRKDLYTKHYAPPAPKEDVLPKKTKKVKDDGS